MPPHLLIIEFSVDGRCGVDDIFPFIHQLLSDNRVILCDHPDDVVSRLDGVTMPNRLCALAKGQFENIVRKSLLQSFTDLARDCAPHVGDENNILQCRHFAAEFAECAEIPSGDSGLPTVADTIDVDNPGKLGPLPISVAKFSFEDQGQGTPMYAYTAAKKATTIFKTSSAPEGKSDPGVSMRVTILPSRLNPSESCTPVMHDSEPIGSGRFEPLARLINWVYSG